MRILVSVLAAACALCATLAAAQTALFTDEAPLTLTLDAPFAQIVARAPRSLEPWPATLTLAGAAPLAVQVNPRGISRRIGGFCTFPPLAIGFEKASVRGTLFDGQKKLKLVSACKPGPVYEQYLVREYTAYRLYNLLSPMSLRVRPAQMTYHDTESRRGDRTSFAFLIESIDDLAARNDRVELETGVNTVAYAQLEPAATTRYALFQYMIGNLDWDYTSGPAGEKCCHNNKLIARAGAAADFVSVPYDFDYSGFVDTPYSVPPANVPVFDVRTRYFRGLCRFRDEIPAAVTLFQAKRADLLALIAAEPRLTAASKQNATRYLEGFFATLDDPEKLRKELTGRCRGN